MPHDGEALLVSELIEELRGALVEDFGDVWVEGEVRDLHRSGPGHVYLELFDGDAALDAILFRSDAARVPFALREGLSVRAHGRLDVWAPRGQLRLIVDALQPAGEGALRVAFERLKARLADEGLFDPAHKQRLPFLPRRIGLVTSSGGAALHDFLRALRRRCRAADVVMCHARVQGDGAWREVVRALHLLDADPSIDVIVIARGGGSREDLSTFNTEEVVRAVFDVQTPVVSAIGHETDTVLCDLVADLRAATPTAAATAVVPDAAEQLGRVGALERRLLARQRARLRELSGRLAGVRRGVVHPARRLAGLRERLASADSRLRLALGREQKRRAALLRTAGGRLDALSPLAVLGRGYALARRDSDGAILRAPSQVAPGDGIRVRLAEGSLRATVTDATPESER